MTPDIFGHLVTYGWTKDLWIFREFRISLLPPKYSLPRIQRHNDIFLVPWFHSIGASSLDIDARNHYWMANHVITLSDLVTGDGLSYLHGDIQPVYTSTWFYQYCISICDWHNMSTLRRDWDMWIKFLLKGTSCRNTLLTSSGPWNAITHCSYFWRFSQDIKIMNKHNY